MKRIISITLFVIILYCFFCSCALNQSKTIPSLQTYSITDCVYELPSIPNTNIHYPIINNIKKQSNEIIHANLVEIISNYLLDSNVQYFDITYSVMFQDQSRISLLFFVKYSNYRSAHPVEEAFPVNLDLIKEKELSLYDICKVDSKFETLIKNEFSQNTTDEIVSFYNCDCMFEDLLLTDDYATSFYISCNNKLGVIINLPSALGNYRFFETSISLHN